MFNDNDVQLYMMTTQMMMILTLYYNNMFNDNDVQLYMMTAQMMMILTLY